MNFLKDTVWYSLSKASMGATNFLIITFVMIFYGDSIYSEYSLVIAYVFMIVPFSVGWVNQSYIRTYQDEKEYSDDLFSTAFFTLMITLTLSSIISYYVFSLVRYIDLVSYSLFVILYGYNLFFMIHLQANLKSRQLAMLEVSRAIVLLLSFLLLQKIIPTPYLPWIISFIISILLFFRVVGSDVKIKFNIDKNYLQHFFTYGSGISIWFGCFLLIPVIDRELLSIRLGESDKGVYFIIFDFCNRIYGLLLSPIVMAVLSHGFKLKSDGASSAQLDAFIKSKLRLVIMIGFPASIVSALLCYLYTFMYLGKNVSNASNVLIVLISSFVGFFWQISMVCQKFLEFRSKVYRMALLMLISMVSILFLEHHLIMNSEYYMYFGLVQIMISIMYSFSCYLYRGTKNESA
ncbi:lipopolysaccharide biosynthesis protein [Vibrio vulnificus]|uniref:lipopolysaccharide biosynthesis protein n=1 Tax=Vibrio vulnificus TaxID=672 RepID=UPI0032426281